jgi:ATP-binding cassette subfamily B multidrug efflux pump
MTGRQVPVAAAPATRLGPWLRELARPWRGRLILVAAAVLGAALLDVIPPFVARYIIDEKITAGRTDGLVHAGAVYLAAIAAAQALSAGYGYLAATIAQHTLATLRQRLFGHLLALPAAYHDRTPTGDSISRCTADVEAIDDLFSVTGTRLLGDTVRLITVVVAMLVLSPALTLVAAVIVPLLLPLTDVLRRRVRTAERDARTAVGLLNVHLQETMGSAETIRAFGAQRRFADRFRQALTRWLATVNRSTAYNAFYAPGVSILGAMVSAALLWVGARSTTETTGITVGTLTAFVLLFARFFTPLIALGDEWQKVQAALAGAERVFAVLALRADTTPPAAAAHVVCRTGSTAAPVVEMRDVRFGYHRDRPVLHGVSLTVRAGEHVAIVGRTGAGKSSILNLLAGLYAPWSGTVGLGGRDPRTITDDERRHLAGMVPQTVQLFTGTVTENLTLADPGSAERARRAAIITGADAFIRTLPDGYETVLSGGHGDATQLSAGQRQWIALTRAMVHEPAVLLLDEATASIDGASDAALRAALRRLVTETGTGVLTVAHRLATARQADRIIVLDAGTVVEQGPPDDLLAAGGRFADLATLDLATPDGEVAAERARTRGR